MARTASTEKSEKNFSRRILVTIKRDMTEITPRVIWQHEKPLFDELFDKDNVVVVDSGTLDDGYSPKARPELLAYNKTMETVARPSDSLGLGFVFIGSADAEFQRLTEAFGKHPTENKPLVEVIYGRAQDGRFAALIGTPELSDLPEPQLRSLLLDYGYAPEPHKDAAPDQKNEMWAKRKALAAMQQKDLVALAEELGVQVG